jgi:tetratricopeptide (TPR) repeat protein
MAGNILVSDGAARLAAAETALTKALSLVPEHPLAHVYLGYVQIYTNRVTQGIAEFERALALDRNLAPAHGWIGLAKYFIGRGEESEGHVREALRLSPRDPHVYYWMIVAGGTKLALGRDDEAVVQLRQSIEANRNLPLAHFFLAAALAHLGRLDEARTAVQAGLALDPGFNLRRFRASAGSDNPTFLAQRERFYDGMRKAGVPTG